MGGGKKRVSLLGMRSDKKWALRAIPADKSLIRDALINELARPYFEFTPQVRHCEVIIDGIYHGVYILSEQITHRHLGMAKPDSKKTDKPKGYIFQTDRPVENRYISKYHPRTNDGKEITFHNTPFKFEGVEFDEMTEEQRSFICSKIDKFEEAIANVDLSDSKKRYDNILDIQSFIDYQLTTEFAHNADGYLASVFLYTLAKDSPVKLAIWDFDGSFGNASTAWDGYRTETWQYDANDMLVKRAVHESSRENKFVPFWWKHLNNDSVYRERLQQRWAFYREHAYRTEHIYQLIDSLTTELTCHGAESRNSAAWVTWQTAPSSKRFQTKSYEEEIESMKIWIALRLCFMDEQLLKIPVNKQYMDSLYSKIGKLVLAN